MSHLQANCVAIPGSSYVRYAQNVYIKQFKDPEGVGEGLFFGHAMRKGDLVGIYEHFTGGQRLTSGRIKSDTHK